MRKIEGLSPDEERVVALLREQWQQPFRITTVQQAVAALGMPPDDPRRLRIGRYLAAHPSLNERLERWGAVPFILTEGEKLLARSLWDSWQGSRTTPPIPELSVALGEPWQVVEAGLSVLAELGFLRWQDGAYAPAEDFEERADGLGFNFHTVTLENGERFNVP